MTDIQIREWCEAHIEEPVKQFINEGNEYKYLHSIEYENGDTYEFTVVGRWMEKKTIRINGEIVKEF